MTVTATMLFGAPRKEIASTLGSLYAACSSASLVSGFLTVEGAEALIGPLATDPAKLACLVTGAATWRAFAAFDRLIDAGVPQDRLKIHLGHSRRTGANAKHRFYRYHPMLHSKVYLFEAGDRCSAVVGSHNMTGFALHGLNSEAGVLLEGPADDKVFSDIRTHVGQAALEANEYNPAEKDAYAWWAEQFMEGFAAKFDDKPRDEQSKRTIVILAEGKAAPADQDVIYFELPDALGKVQSLSAEVHIYLFPRLPPSPAAALQQLGAASHAMWCSTIGIEDDRGGRELRADWLVADARAPRLEPTPRPFRPTPAPGMQQVRVRARPLFGRFDYLFGSSKAVWEPVLDEGEGIVLPVEAGTRSKELELVPPEHLPWFRVVGLRHRAETDDPRKQILRQLSPEGGGYVLMSTRRLVR